MRIILLLIVLIMGVTSSNAQESLFKQAWLEKWQNSKEYLIAIAEKMPDSLYGYKPTDREMSFGAQLEHINQNMEWLSTTYFEKQEAELSTNTNENKRIIANLQNAFDLIYATIQSYPESKLKEKIDFFAGEKSKL